MAAVRKRHTEHKAEPSSAKATEGQGKQVTGEPKEPVVVSDTVTEITERIEIIKEDPLTDFKERMIEEESPISDVPAKKNYMWPILFIFIIALVILSGIFVYKNTKSEKVNVVTLTATPTAIPQPTKTVDLSKYEIKILNGSEVGGEASRQKESLEKEGFTVFSIGNAANSNYTETIIQAKKDVDQAYLNKLKSVLELSFVVGDSEELPQDADSDVIVIIGSQTN